MMFEVIEEKIVEDDNNLVFEFGVVDLLKK